MSSEEAELAAQFIDKVFSYNLSTGELYWIYLDSFSEQKVRISAITLRGCWCRVSLSCLIFAGGRDPSQPDNSTRSVWKINTKLDFAVFEQPSMVNQRAGHGMAFDGAYIYAIGGCTITNFNRTCLKSCERLLATSSEWETIPDIPNPVAGVNPTIFKGELYAIGGTVDGKMYPFDANTDCCDLIQVLNLETLTWRTLEVRIALKDYWMPCFVVNSQLYLCNRDKLVRIDADAITEVASLTDSIYCFGGASCYRNLNLICSNHVGTALRVEIPQLSSGPNSMSS